MAETVYLKPIQGLNIEKGRKFIEEAAEHLKQTAMKLRLVESVGLSPYRITKIANIMAKAAYVDHSILKFLLGEITEDRMHIELRTHSAMLLLAELEDQEAEP